MAEIKSLVLAIAQADHDRDVHSQNAEQQRERIQYVDAAEGYKAGQTAEAELAAAEAASKHVLDIINKLKQEQVSDAEYSEAKRQAREDESTSDDLRPYLAK